MQIRGIPPKWVSSGVIAQISKSFGLLIDIDWAEVFKSLYETVRVKIAVRNPLKIPPDRMVVMRKKFYLLQFTVEWDGVDIDSIMGLKDKDNEGDDMDDDNIMDDEIQDLEKSRKDGKKSKDTLAEKEQPSSSSLPKTNNAANLNSLQVLADAGLIDSYDDEEHTEEMTSVLKSWSMAENSETTTAENSNNAAAEIPSAAAPANSAGNETHLISDSESFPTPAGLKKLLLKKTWRYH